ncbi:rCG33307, partial [Rattus norvegicus]
MAWRANLACLIKAG